MNTKYPVNFQKLPKMANLSNLHIVPGPTKSVHILGTKFYEFLSPKIKQMLTFDSS